jgi:hypothetical protein
MNLEQFDTSITEEKDATGGIVDPARGNVVGRQGGLGARAFAGG